MVPASPQGALLERRLEALSEALEMKEAQLAEVLTAANLEPSTLQVSVPCRMQSPGLTVSYVSSSHSMIPMPMAAGHQCSPGRGA
jgi:hypothetical protein